MNSDNNYYATQFYSRNFKENCWIVPDAIDTDILADESINPNDIIFFHSEIPHLKITPQEILEKIILIKSVFRGSRIVEDKPS